MSNYQPPRPEQLAWVHILFAFFTAGIGNLIYFFVVRDKQNEWDRNYRQ